MYLGKTFHSSMIRLLCMLCVSLIFISCTAQCPEDKVLAVNTINARAIALTPGRAQLTQFGTRTTSTIVATAGYNATERAVTFQQDQSLLSHFYTLRIMYEGFTAVMVVKFRSQGSQTLFDLFQAAHRITMWSPGGTTIRMGIRHQTNWCVAQNDNIVLNEWLTVVITYRIPDNRLSIQIGNNLQSVVCAPARADVSGVAQLGGAQDGHGFFTGSIRGFYAVDSMLSNATITSMISNMHADKDTLKVCEFCPVGLEVDASNTSCVAPCPANSTRTLDKSACLCQAGFTGDNTGPNIRNVRCQQCPVNATSLPGTRLRSDCTCAANQYMIPQKNVARECGHGSVGQACVSSMSSPSGNTNMHAGRANNDIFTDVAPRPARGTTSRRSG